MAHNLTSGSTGSAVEMCVRTAVRDSGVLGVLEAKGLLMSLDVPPTLLRQAEEGDVDEDAFVETVRTSLPYAYELIESLVTELGAGNDPFADNQVPPPSEAERGQLLRALASDAIRGSLERHFGVRLAFQNCHRVAAFRLDAPAESLQRFTSIRGQLLNQSPLLRDC